MFHMFGKSDKAMKKPSAKRTYQRDEEDRIIVNMTVKDDSNFLSVFSEKDTPVISTEVADFIEHSTTSVNPKERLTLKIHSDCIDDQEKALYREAITEYYTEKYIANKRELKRNNIITLLLTVMGVTVLALAILFEYRMNSLIWYEVIDIVAWVLLWEAVDISAFGNRALRIKQKYCLAYLSMKVEYVPLNVQIKRLQNRGTIKKSLIANT